MSEHQIHSAAVSRLRDAGVILASGPKGYKIPTRESDIEEFVTHADTIVPPMLARLKRARNELSMVSLKTPDILAHPRFAELRRLIDASSFNGGTL